MFWSYCWLGVILDHYSRIPELSVRGGREIRQTLPWRTLQAIGVGWYSVV